MAHLPTGLYGIVIAVVAAHLLYDPPPTLASTAGRHLTGSCWSGGVQVDRPLIVWVEHTLADTGGFARQNRSGASLPLSPSSSASVVTTDSLCDALTYRFAKAVEGRDTVNIAPVHAVKIDTSYFVVTDYMPRAVAAVHVSGDTLHFTGRPQWTDAVTFDANMDVVRVWKYVYSSHYGSPY